MSKYKRGALIKSVGEFSDWLDLDGRVYDDRSKKVYSVGWMQSWPFHYIKNLIKGGNLYKAVEK